MSAFAKIPFGEQMLEIFAEAVSKKIEQMFSTDTSKQQTDTKAIADEIYAKMVAVNASPVMHILSTLAGNIVDSPNSPTAAPNSKAPQGAPPGMTAEDQMMMQMHTQSAPSKSLTSGGSSGTRRSDVVIQNSSMGF